MDNKDLLYIIFCFLIVPFKKECLEKLNTLNDNDNNINNFFTICEENKNSIIEDFVTRNINLYDGFFR